MKREHVFDIVHLMDTAKLHLKWPKVRLNSKTIKIQLSVAGPNARQPDTINITSVGAYGHNTFYGRIHRDGYLQYARETTNISRTSIENELTSFVKNPAEYAKLYSNATGNCMFCAKLLTDPQSVAVGYGPICAAHFGLPHGELETEIANDLTQIEIEMPTVCEDKPQSIEDKVAYLELKVEQLEASLYRMQSNGG